MDANIAKDFGHMINNVGFDSLHLMAIIFCVFVFQYQLKVLADARFLRNIKHCYILMGIAYLGNIAFSVITFLIAQKSNVSADAIKESIIGISSIWDLVNICLSISSSYFLFRAWYLIKRLPFFTFPKGISAAGQIALNGIVSLAIASIIEKTGTLVFLMGVIDVIAAATTCILVGREMWNFKHNPVNPKHRAWAPFIRLGALISFGAWGILQLPFILILMQNMHILTIEKIGEALRESGGLYYVALMIFKVICAMFAAVFAILFVEDRRKFQDPSDGIIE